MMDKYFKKLGRPASRIAIRCLEQLTSFHTDPQGYIPNRLKMVTRRYEREIVQQMCNELPRGGTFVDVGANVGYVSRAVVESCKGNCRILAFEPNPQIYCMLVSNLAKYPSVTCCQTALGAGSGTARFYEGRDSCVGSLVEGYPELHHSGDGSQSGGRQFDVPVVKGDDILSELPRIDVMKIDVEGYEEPVLQGCAQLISKGKIRTIFMELMPLAQRASGRTALSAVNYLRQQGYSIFGAEDELINVQLHDEDLQNLVNSLGDRGYTTIKAVWPA